MTERTSGQLPGTSMVISSSQQGNTFALRPRETFPCRDDSVLLQKLLLLVDGAFRDGAFNGVPPGTIQAAQ